MMGLKCILIGFVSRIPHPCLVSGFSLAPHFGVQTQEDRCKKKEKVPGRRGLSLLNKGFPPPPHHHPRARAQPQARPLSEHGLFNGKR